MSRSDRLLSKTGGNKMMNKKYFLAGDIGGTKTNLAVFTVEDGPLAPIYEKKFASSSYAGLDAIINEFLAETDIQVKRACFGVAGPVVAGRAAITNLPWVIDAEQLQSSCGLKLVHLINDLAATASAVPYLASDDLHTLNSGNAVSNGAIAVIAPGTGLGEAFLTWNGSAYSAHPSEGGHSDFAPGNEMELDLLRYLQGRYDHVSYEHICSGLGLPNIFDFLNEKETYPEPQWLAEQLRQGDPVPVIVNAALDADKNCKICSATLDIFVSVLGAEAGNLALKVLATGGVYLGGGIPPRILKVLQNGSFMRAFRSKGRLSETLAGMPVHVIMNPKAALLGAAYFVLQQEKSDG